MTFDWNRCSAYPSSCPSLYPLSFSFSFSYLTSSVYLYPSPSSTSCDLPEISSVPALVRFVVAPRAASIEDEVGEEVDLGDVESFGNLGT